MLDNLAFVFPGQGSQSLGMLGELAAARAQVRAAFDEASAGCDADLWTISQQGPEEQLSQTEFTQPALLAAHAYVRYLGDLAGGQALGRIARQAYALPDGAGTRFFDFGQCSTTSRDSAIFIDIFENTTQNNCILE